MPSGKAIAAGIIQGLTLLQENRKALKLQNEELARIKENDKVERAYKQALIKKSELDMQNSQFDLDRKQDLLDKYRQIQAANIINGSNNDLSGYTDLSGRYSLDAQAPAQTSAQQNAGLVSGLMRGQSGTATQELPMSFDAFEYSQSPKGQAALRTEQRQNAADQRAQEEMGWKIEDRDTKLKDKEFEENYEKAKSQILKHINEGTKLGPDIQDFTAKIKQYEGTKLTAKQVNTLVQDYQTKVAEANKAISDLRANGTTDDEIYNMMQQAGFNPEAFGLTKTAPKPPKKGWF